MQKETSRVFGVGAKITMSGQEKFKNPVENVWGKLKLITD